MRFINRIGKLSGGTVDVQVASAANCGYWIGSSVFGDTYLGIGYGSPDTINGFALFNGINIGKSVAKTANLYMTYAAQAGTALGDVYFNDAETPTVPTSAASAAAKTKTTNKVTGDPGANGAKTYNVLAIVNELLASYGPYSGGSMMILVIGEGSGNNYGWFTGYGSPNARLVITW